MVTFTADLGQGEELGPARDKALLMGVEPHNIFIEDLRERFVADFVFPMFRANALYEGAYLLGTAIARPLIAQAQIAIARKVGAAAVCHGATGKGNDQVRFELAYYALAPDIEVIAPWREWDFKSREALIAFAEAHQIPISKDKRGDAPFSVDANLLHSSSEGKVLEDPSLRRPEFVHKRTLAPEDAPDRATEIRIDFEAGDPVAIDGERRSPAALLGALNTLGRDSGVGRLDLVENRFIGMKSRGVYEIPGWDHPPGRPSRDQIPHPGRRGDAPQGRVDAEVRGADLQRLVVLAGAGDVAGCDRSIAGQGHRPGLRSSSIRAM